MKYFFRILFLCSYIGLLFLLYAPIYDDVELSFYSCKEINCSSILVELLKRFPKHVCALYDLEDDELYSHINEGVLFEENYEEKYLKLQKVSSKGLMHNKFCVFNEQYVLTGSWNPTQRGTNYNDNYILLIDSDKVAQTFLEEYEHLLNRNKKVSSLHVRYNNSQVELYFCPQHDCQQQVLDTLSQAKKSVKVLSFTFTDKEIAEELLSLSRRNISVDIVYEKTRITRYSTIRIFDGSLVNTYLDGNPYTMHEKMFIIDEEIVILGSYNPTIGATQKNDENLLIIQDSILAKNALDEYYRVLNQVIS